jgi:hypothetical protein
LARNNRNIVVNGVKHHHTNKKNNFLVTESGKSQNQFPYKSIEIGKRLVMVGTESTYP